MNKIELTFFQKSRVIQAQKNTLVHKYLRNKESINFNIGDVIIRKTVFVHGIEVVTIPGTKFPIKYRIVHIDQYGIPYTQRILISGKLQKDDIDCLAHKDLDFQKFELDPDFVDYILLGNDPATYDPYRHYKE